MVISLRSSRRGVCLMVLADIRSNLQHHDVCMYSEIRRTILSPGGKTFALD